MHDGQLLAEYLGRGNQAAFTQLVERYLRLVYSTCRHEIGDTGLAEDAAQAVFLLLARKAPTLKSHTSLAGWLFSAARLVSRNALRQERRRQRREEKAMEEVLRSRRDAEADAALWDEIEPWLNDVLASLNGRDREAILLRFFQGLSLAETGSVMGVSAEAAQMRVARALEKMRRHLSRQDISVSGAELTLMLPSRAVHALPVGWTARGLVSVSRPGPGLGPNVLKFYQGAVKTMWMTNVKMAAVLGTGLIGLTSATLKVAHVHSPQTQTRAVTQTQQSITLAVGAGRVSAFDPRAQRLLDQMTAAYGSLSSYSGTMEVVIANGPEAVTAMQASSAPQIRASIALKKPDRAAVRATGTDISSRVAEGVCDGKTYTELRRMDSHIDGKLRPQTTDYRPGTTTAQVLNFAFGAGGPIINSSMLHYLLADPNPLAGWLHDASALKIGKSSVVGGVPVDTVVLVGPVRHDQTGDTHAPFTHVTKWFLSIGVRDHLLRRIASEDTLLVPGTGMRGLPSGTVMFVQMETFQKVRANPTLPASTWTFESLS